MLLPQSMPWLEEYLGSVNSKLADLCPPGGTTLESAVAKALSGGGKRVRGILALLWCEAFSGDYRPAVPLAAAYELAHASALVQDDIIDKSDMRRGEKSVVAEYGLSNALLASDLLLFNVPKMVATYTDLESARLARLFDLVGEACRATTWGEFLDLELALREEGTERDYERMIRLKTSTLLSAPCASGAIVARASDEQVSLAQRFGEWLGMAYQVHDDTLDLIGDESVLGKRLFTDLRGGKKGIALIHCAKRCSEEDRRFIFSLLNRSGAYESYELSRLKKLIEEHGSLKYVEDKVVGYTRRARDLLEAVPEGAAQSRLGELAEYLAIRYY